MTIYRVLRKSGDRIEFYYPHESFALDNWTEQPNTYVWNTVLVAIALHVVAVEREKERIMETNREVWIQAYKGDEVWVVNESEYAYAGRI